MYSNSIQYTKIPNEVIFDTNITPTEKVVYMALCAYDINENGIVDNLKYDMLAELVGLSRSRVKQVINKLVEKGYVIKHTYEQLKANGKIVYNGTRNKYVLPKKIITDRLIKLSTKVENLPPKDENLPPKDQNSSTDRGKNETPIYNIDNNDDNDNVENEIKELEAKEGEEIVGKALKKMGKYSIQHKKGFISYLKKTIETIKQYTYKKVSTYINKKPNTYKNYNKNKKESTFNNFDNRNYDFEKLQKALLGWDKSIELKDCMI